MKIISNESIAILIWDIIQRIANLGNYTMGQFGSLNNSIVVGINSIANYGVKPLASILLSLFALMELMDWSTKADNSGLAIGGNARLELLGLSLLKISFIVYFIQSIDNFLWGIFAAGNLLMSNIRSVNGSGGGTLATGLSHEDILKKLIAMNMGFMQTNYQYLIVLVVYLFIMASSIAIWIIMTGRMIQIYVMVALAPLPLCTLIHREQSQIGKNFIKSFVAVVLQGAVMVVIVQVYSVLIQGAVIEKDSIDSILFSSAGYAFILIISLAGAGKLAKQITNAM